MEKGYIGNAHEARPGLLVRGAVRAVFLPGDVFNSECGRLCALVLALPPFWIVYAGAFLLAVMHWRLLLFAGTPLCLVLACLWKRYCAGHYRVEREKRRRREEEERRVCEENETELREINEGFMELVIHRGLLTEEQCTEYYNLCDDLDELRRERPDFPIHSALEFRERLLKRVESAVIRHKCLGDHAGVAAENAGMVPEGDA